MRFCPKVKMLSALTLNIQEAQEPKYQNRHKNSRIFHFIEVAKKRQKSSVNVYTGSGSKSATRSKVYNSTWITRDPKQT